LRQSKTYTRLAGPNLFNWRLFWSSYLILFIPQILFDVIAFGSLSWLWLPIWTSSHLGAAAFVMLAKALGFDRLQRKHPSAMANLSLAAVAGIIRVVWVGEISYELELVTEFSLGARIASGVVLGVLLFVALTNVLEINRNYSIALKSLLQTQAQLGQLRKLSSRQFAQTQLAITRDTREVIEPRLGEIARRLRSQNLSYKLRNSLANDLKDILENQVKPLNRELRALGKGFESPDLQAGVRRSTLYRLPPRVFADLAIGPFWILVLLLGVLPFSLYVFEGAQWALLGVGISGLNYVLIYIAKYFLRRQGLVPLSKAVFQYILLISQMVALNHFLILLAGYPESSAPFVSVMLFITLTFTILAVGLEAVQENNRSEFLTQIARNNARIERELGLLNQRVWVEKRRWALLVHGTVQGSLTAALARLKGGDDLDPAELRRIAKHVLQAKNGLNGPRDKTFDLQDSIKKQAQTWAGIMKVVVDYKSPEFVKLTKDKWAGFCANEIIKEALSNAFRHGSAKNVWLSFETETPGFVTIVVSNDGKSPGKKRSMGLGSQLLSEIAYPWSLVKDPQGYVVLKAQIPVGSLAEKSNNRKKAKAKSNR